MNTCDRCGYPIEDGLMYCEHCAAEVKSILGDDEQFEQEQAYQEGQLKSRKEDT